MLKIENLTKRFGEKAAVDNLSFEVKEGSVFGFLGPNGAGKTTTLRMILGLLQPDNGSIIVNGIDAQKDNIAVKQITGYLPDEIFLYDYLSGRDFLNFVADIYGLRKKEKEEKVEKLLQQFDLVDAANEYSANYSLGMKKKLALAGTVIHDPQLLILDEPFNGLDPQATRDLRQLLKQMAENGTTIIFSSHVLEVVEKIVTHAGIINHGKLAISATIEDIAKEYGSLEQAFFKITEK